MRCLARAVMGRELPQALADCNESLRLSPNDAGTLDARGSYQPEVQPVWMTPSRIMTRRSSLFLRFAAALYGRGLARQRKGNPSDGDADIAAARAIRADIAERFTGDAVK